MLGLPKIDLPKDADGNSYAGYLVVAACVGAMLALFINAVFG